MSTPKRLLWMKWKPADWRAEPRLKMVSRAARSLWVDMLGLMHESEPYGFLIVARKSLTTAALIAQALGDSEEALSPLLAELEAAGVFSRVGDADLCDDVAALVPATVSRETILSRKMVREAAKREKDQANGGKGGNPKLRGITEGLTQGITERVDPTDKAKRLETREEEKRNAADAARSQDSKPGTPSAPVVPLFSNGPSGDGASQQAVDRKWLFNEGLNWLSQTGARERGGLRGFVVTLLQKAGDNATLVRGAFEEASRRNAGVPTSWLVRAVETRAKAAAPSMPFVDDSVWRDRLRSYRDNGGTAWPASWGECPAHWLAEFGFQKQHAPKAARRTCSIERRINS